LLPQYVRLKAKIHQNAISMLTLQRFFSSPSWILGPNSKGWEWDVREERGVEGRKWKGRE